MELKKSWRKLVRFGEEEESFLVDIILSALKVLSLLTLNFLVKNHSQPTFTLKFTYLVLTFYSVVSHVCHINKNIHMKNESMLNQQQQQKVDRRNLTAAVILLFQFSIKHFRLWNVREHSNYFICITFTSLLIIEGGKSFSRKLNASVVNLWEKKGKI